MLQSSRFMLYLVERMLFLIEFMQEHDILARDKNGGYLCVLDAETGRVLILMPIGSIPKGKAMEYRKNALEKARRLFRLRRKDQSQWSSWQSRREDKGMWGGAIASANFIYSFSAFPQLVDE